MNSVTSLELFKRRHARQNKELVRINALYAHQIQKLQADLAFLRNENLSLRQEVIQWKVLHERQTLVIQTREDQEQQFDPPSLSPSMSPPPSPQTQSHPCQHNRGRRQRMNVSYALPNVKKKLRKGDPFTFGR